MSKISEAHDQLMAALLYEDGTPEELARARALLAADSEFRAEYESMLETRSLLGTWPNVASVPRLVYVTEPTGFVTRVRRWVSELGALGLRPLLRPAAGLAAAALVLVVAVSVLRFQVGPDGVMQVAFRGGEGAVPAVSMMAADNAAEASGPITRAEFEAGLTEMAGYIQRIVNDARQEDRTTILATLEQRLNERDLFLTEATLSAVQNAFNELDARHAAEFATVLTSLQDIQISTATELQRTNAILAALLQPGDIREEK
jgi:hypothetical protein